MFFALVRVALVLLFLVFAWVLRSLFVAFSPLAFLLLSGLFWYQVTVHKRPRRRRVGAKRDAATATGDGGDGASPGTAADSAASTTTPDGAASTASVSTAAATTTSS